MLLIICNKVEGHYVHFEYFAQFRHVLYVKLNDVMLLYSSNHIGEVSLPLYMKFCISLSSWQWSRNCYFIKLMFIAMLKSLSLLLVLNPSLILETSFIQRSVLIVSSHCNIPRSTRLSVPHSFSYQCFVCISCFLCAHYDRYPSYVNHPKYIMGSLYIL